MSQYESFLRLDLTDSGDRELVEFGARILRLLQAPQAEKSQFLVATLDDFLGGLYALIFARHNNRPIEGKRVRPIEVHAVVKRAENVAEGWVRTSGNWLSGFYFNSALFRIAATYHRGLKIVSARENSDDRKSDLLRKVKTPFPGWRHKHLDDIWNEVNHLKHTAKGLFNSRGVSPREANAAVAELLELFEAWSKRGSHAG